MTFAAEYDGSEQRFVIALPNNWEPSAEHDVCVALHGHG